MFSCTVSADPGRVVVKLSGDLIVEHSREIHAELLARLARDCDVTIDLGESARIDLSFVQILSALLKCPDRNVRIANLPTHVTDTAGVLGAGDIIRELSARTGDDA